MSCGLSDAPAGGPIVQYWDTEEVPDYLEERIASFRARNPGMRHLLFDERTAAHFIAERIGQREAEAFRACAVPTMQSDFFRYCAAFALGGVYADVGYRCIAPLDALLEQADGGRLFRVEPFGFLLSGLFAFRFPGHPLPRLALDVIVTNVERRVAERVQMVTGPWVLSGLSALHRLGSDAALRREAAERGIERLAEPLRRDAAAMAPSAGGREAIEPMIEPMLDAVGDYARVTEAFDGVRTTRYASSRRWVREPEAPLPYKRSERYWVNWQRERTIFR